MMSLNKPCYVQRLYLITYLDIFEIIRAESNNLKRLHYNIKVLNLSGGMVIDAILF